MQGRLRLRPSSSGLTKPRWWQKRRFLTLKLKSWLWRHKKHLHLKQEMVKTVFCRNLFCSLFLFSQFTTFAKVSFKSLPTAIQKKIEQDQKWIGFWASWLFKLFWFFADPGEEQSSRWSIWRNVLYPAFKPCATFHSFIVIDATKHFWPFNCSPECDYANQTATLGPGETELKVTGIRSRRFLAIGRQTFVESSSGIFCSS